MPYIPRQYESARDFLNQVPDQLNNIYDPMDKDRVIAYHLYDDFYYNRPDTFRVSLRGDSDIEIYLPSTKKIVDSTARFLAVDQDFQVKGGDQGAVDTLLRNIFQREEIAKKQVKGKKSLLTRGDLAWYLTADLNKPKGKRISINTIHPSCVFPIEDPENAFRVIGYHIVDIIHDPRDSAGDRKKIVARRQTYRKEQGGISSEIRTFELGAWDDRYLKPEDLRPVSIIRPKTMLPQPISELPIYFIPNNEPDGSTFGLSQVSGMEYIINAINQSMTYEDLSLVLQGLGVYVSTAGPPRDSETGKEGKYKLHPGNVIQMSQGDTFERVTGVASVAPFQDHVSSLDTWLLQGSGLPDMATGIVDVSVAQSGIALSLKMGPIIAENQDKQLGIAAKWDQLGYDLIHGWLPAIEGLRSETTEFKSIFGDPMPLNRDAYIKETIDLWDAGLILIEEVRERLEKVGYKKIPSIEEKLLKQKTEWAIAESGDPFAQEGNNPLESLDNSVNGNANQNGQQLMLET
ncbi:portal protein [Mycobacterium phage MrMiyagi]|uniref:Portal protein n=1 Tax=Mycobacterium phage MrMiyagi TaxID=2762395 RepID=A0A7G8LPP6_9CAUD|nr:portal protein [Mycobacterium phage MrMiyagi]